MNLDEIRKLNDFEILRTFKDQVDLFSDDMIDIFTEEYEADSMNKLAEQMIGDLVKIKIVLMTQLPIIDVVNGFIKNVIFDPEARQAIQNNDDNFFIETGDLFGTFSQHKVLDFRKVWKSELLSPEEKEEVFRYFRTFVALGIVYAEKTKMKNKK